MIAPMASSTGNIKQFTKTLYFSKNLPCLFLVPCFFAVISSCSILFSRKSCFLVSISSVSRSLWMASCGVGPAWDRWWCRGFDELDELELELPLNNLVNLLIFYPFLSIASVISPLDSSDLFGCRSHSVKSRFTSSTSFDSTRPTKEPFATPLIITCMT